MTDRSPIRTAEIAGVVLLLGIFLTLSALSMRVKNPTFDETAHIGAGVSYVQLGDYRLNPEHPVLPKMLAGLAATRAGANASATSDAWLKGEQWDFGREVLYESGVDWRRIVYFARLPMVGIGVLLGLLLWRWARALTGPRGALLALWLFAFCPNFLAHTRLVTTDVMLTFTVVGTCACLWQARASGRWPWILAAALFFGLSMVTKFSAFSYAPVYAALALIPSGARSLRRGLLHLALFAVLGTLAAELLVFVCYGFVWEGATIRSLGMAGRGVRPAEMSLLRRIPYEIMARIPWAAEDFARGMKNIILYTEAGHPVYLLGVRSDSGWWWSPFVTLVVKAPLPFLLLALFSAWRIVRERQLRRADLFFLLLPIALVLATNAAANLGLGVRHLLPLFPFLMILIAWPLRSSDFARKPITIAILACGLLWQAVGTVWAHPHYLPYFNEAAGGARGGARILGDSNLDWGQDLSAATAALREQGANGAILCYFGTASPFVEEVDWQILPPTQRAKRYDPWTVLPLEGPQWLAMSVTNLQGVYYRGPGWAKGNAKLRGSPYPWLEGVEPDVIVGGSIYLYEVSRNAHVQMGLAEVYQRHGLQEEAEHALQRLLVLRPFEGEARRTLLRAYLARGEDERIDALIMSSKNPDAWEMSQLAAARKRLGDLEGAKTAYDMGTRFFTHDPDLANEFAWFLQDIEEDLGHALELANRAVDWSPEDVYYRDTRAMVHLKLGYPTAALADLDEALALPGGDLAALHWHRALALAALDRSDEAVAAAERALVSEGLDDETAEQVMLWLSEREP